MGNSNFNNKNSHNPFDNVSDDDDDLFDDIEPVQQGSPSQPQHHHIATNANNRYQFDNSPYRRSSSYDVYNNNPFVGNTSYTNTTTPPPMLQQQQQPALSPLQPPLFNNNGNNNTLYQQQQYKSIELQLAPIQTPHTVLWLIMMNSIAEEENCCFH